MASCESDADCAGLCDGREGSLPACAADSGGCTCSRPAAADEVDPARVAAWSRDALAEPQTSTLASAMQASPHLLVRQGMLRESQGMRLPFSHEVAPRMKPSDQMRTGLCWAFAGLGIVRRHVARRHGLGDDFELSSAFVLFHDKLEKANSFLAHVRETRARPLDDREVQWLLDASVPDGGDWYTFVHLVHKYGVAPRHDMPRTPDARRTKFLNRVLRLVLGRAALRLRRAGDDAARAEAVREGALRAVHRVLCVCLGTPPRRVTLAAAKRGKGEQGGRKDDERGEGGRGPPELLVAGGGKGGGGEEHLTPRGLFARVEAQMDLRGYVVLVHAPVDELRLHAPYVVRFLDGVRGEAPRAVYVPVADLRPHVVRSLVERQSPVWFGCDYHLPYRGVLHHDAIDVRALTGEPTRLDDEEKRERVLGRVADPNHAMLVTGVHVERGRRRPSQGRAEAGVVTRWQIENSHGDADADGYLAATSPWMMMHGYTAAVHRSVLPEHVRMSAGVDGGTTAPPPTVLPPWHIVGRLTRVVVD
jgi:bleomycin hydrolase